MPDRFEVFRQDLPISTYESKVEERLYLSRIIWFPMEITYVIDALSAAFFALLAIWAAVGQGHWFLRVLVVGAFLLAALLLPAYEVVLEYGLATALIAAGVWVAHGRKKWERRFSLQTIMLAMVVVAVACAVVGAASELSFSQWSSVVGVGLVVAAIGLACLWVVFGTRFNWPRRVVGGLVALGALFIASYGAVRLQGVVQTALYGGNARMNIGRFLSQTRLTDWLEYYLWTAGLCIGMILAALLLARGSRWFGRESDDSPTPLDGKTIACSTAMVTLCLAICLPLSYLYYRLMTPTPFPVVEMPQANAYDDLVAAGQPLSDNVPGLVGMAQNMTAEQLRSELEKLEPARARLRQALDKEIRISRAAIPKEMFVQRMRDVSVALSVLALEANYAKKTGDIERQWELAQQLGRFWIAIEDGLGLEYSINGWLQAGLSIDEVKALGPEKCKEFARQLWKLQQSRLSLEERIDLMHIVYENHSWKHHLNQMIQQWSGEDSQSNLRHTYQLSRAKAGLLILQLAIEAYRQDHDELPRSLAELVPEYLPAEIDDPFGTDRLQYRNWDSEYAVFSVGNDGKPGEHRQSDRDANIPTATAGDDIVEYGPVWALP